MTTISVRLEGFSALAASLGEQARQIPSPRLINPHN
jgi:hypothetical protein